MPAPTLNELTAMLKAMGWKLDKVANPNKTTGKYVAKATGPAGQKGERDGDTPERAVGNLLIFAQHHNAIRSYAALDHKIAMWHTPWASQLDEIGHAYGQLPVYDPKAVDAWHALANESKMQADAIRKQINVKVTDDPEPYPHHAAMLHDIHHNQNFLVSRAHSDHPVWSPEDNVNFRIVHDVLGHGQSGGDFGWEGENRACGIHFPMVSPLARRALFTECIGQTAYALRKGSHGFGPQKVALMPQFLDPVEEMNGEHVHVPSGKLVYPNEIMPVETPAWGWHEDPNRPGTWKQTPGVNPSAAESAQAPGGVVSRVQSSGAMATPYIPPHHQTPLEYPDRAAHVSIEPSDEHDLILPHTAADPNMYAHSNFVAPLTTPGSSDDYIRRGDVESNVAKFAQPEDPFISMTPERQKQVIRNAFSAVILSPRKDLKGNAQQYQAIADLPGDAPLEDVFHKIMSARSYHNFHTAQGEKADPTDYEGEHHFFGMNRPTYEKQLQTLHAYIKTQQDVSDAKAWELTKKTLSAMYKQVEPSAEAAIEAEGGDINTMRVRIKTIEMANAWLESIIGGPREWHEPGQEQNLFGEPAGLSPERGKGQVPSDLPGIPVQSKIANDADVPDEPEEESRYSGVVYGHLEGISNITAQHLEIMRQYAVKDISEDGGRGFIFRAGCVALNVPGIGPKTASFAWLLIEPHSSELGIIDTHVMRGLGFEDRDLTNKNYYMMERMQRNLKDSTGYGDMPLGKFHWGMWDMMRTPGRVSDHRALRPFNYMPWDHPDMEHGSSLGNKPIARDEEPIFVGPDALRRARPLLEQVQDDWYNEQMNGPKPFGTAHKRPYTHYRQGLTPDRPQHQVPATWQPTAKTVSFNNVPSWLEQKADGTWGPKDESLSPYDTTWPDVRAAGVQSHYYAPGTRMVCSDSVSRNGPRGCGHEWTSEDGDNTCPNCGQPNGESSLSKSFHERNIYQPATTLDPNGGHWAPRSSSEDWYDQPLRTAASIDFGRYVEEAGGDTMAAQRRLYETLKEQGMDAQSAWSAALEYERNWSMYNPTHHQLETYPERYAPDAKPRAFGEKPEYTNMDWAEQAAGGVVAPEDKPCPNCGGKLMATMSGDNGDVVECKQCHHEFLEDSEGAQLHDMGVNERNKGTMPEEPEPTGDLWPDTIPSDWE